MNRNLSLAFAFGIVLLALAAFGHPLVVANRTVVTDTLRIVDTVAVRTVHDAGPACTDGTLRVTILRRHDTWAAYGYDVRLPDGSERRLQGRGGHANGEQVCL